MINKASYTKDWLESFRKNTAYNKSDPALIEKMIMALTLLEQLAIHKLDFLFKGGTALILLLENANRFSVDIDITTNEEKEILETILDQITKTSVFKEVKPDKRNKRGSLNKAHYKFYYDSEISLVSKNRMANYVLLDVVFEKSVYPELKSLQIKTKWIRTEEPYFQINVPSVNSILGDKLTAFAPNTTGIEYGKGKEIEIIKQLYDVSVLIDSISNISMVYNSFLETAKKEISYRQLDNDETGVLDDTFETALLIARRDKNTGEDKLKFTEIQKGIKNFGNFIISRSFRIDEAIEASAKTAWFAMKLKNTNFDDLVHFHSDMDIAKLAIENEEYQFLNKLKKGNKAAFYYWYQCILEISRSSDSLLQ